MSGVGVWQGRAPPHGEAQDDWLWGTGSHALSATSLCARVSRVRTLRHGRASSAPHSDCCLRDTPSAALTTSESSSSEARA